MTRLLMYALALFRFTMLLYEEEGPGGVLLDMRNHLGLKEYKELSMVDGEVRAEFIKQTNGFWAELLSCPFCLSGWIAIPLALGYYTKWWLMELVAAWGAIWAGAYILLRLLGHNPVGEDEE